MGSLDIEIVYWPDKENPCFIDYWAGVFPNQRCARICVYDDGYGVYGFPTTSQQYTYDEEASTLKRARSLAIDFVLAGSEDAESLDV